MRAATHAAIALLLSVLILKQFSFNNGSVIIIGSVFFSLLPDIDTSKSFIGKRSRPISYVIEFFLKHRGMLHTLWAVFILAVPAFAYDFALGLAVMIGFGSHIGVDAATPAGIKPLMPFGPKLRGPVRTGSLTEHGILLASVLVSLAVIFGVYSL